MNPDGLPSDAKFLDALITLSHELNLTLREDELVKIFSDIFEELLPERRFAIRLIDAKASSLQLVYANGRLADNGRDRFRITAAAFEGLKLSKTEVEYLISNAKLEKVEEYKPIFVDGTIGFEVALCDRKKFYGMLNFEYLEESAPESMDADRRVALPLAHQLGAAIRNTKLISETIFLKNYLEKLLDRANAPMLVCDKDGTITVFNQAMENQTGLNRNDILGEDFMSLIPESDRARLLPMVINALRGESATNVEVKIPKAGGKEMAHISFNTASIVSTFGEVEGVIFTGQDLSEIRNLQKQVIHTEKLATLGQVAAGVAHELNNPLTSITVYANYLSKKLGGSIDESDMLKLERIIEAAERIQLFTKDLVTYARPSGEEPTLIKIGELMERSLSFCEHLVSQHNAIVSLDIDKNLEPIYGIHGQLEQVFVNLLTNSCHALPQQGGTIAISARPLGEDRIEVRFADTGQGIPKENLSQVFEPFFTTKNHGDGTGLGLSIVRNILRNHDSEINVESEVGKGTVFTIAFYTG